MSTKIEWAATYNADGTVTAGRTWNPTVGCAIYSTGCKNCYAMQMAARLEAMGQKKYDGLTRKVNGRTVWTGEVRCVEEALDAPLHVKKPTTWFVNSMSDLFFGDAQDEAFCRRAGVPFQPVPDEFLDRVFAVMAAASQHTFQVLTKRPARMREYLANHEARRRLVWNAKCDLGKPVRPMEWPLPNVWLGTSVEDQCRADERIPLLLQVPAAVRFLSCEPLLGPVDLTGVLPWDVNEPHPQEGWRATQVRRGVQWVIAGGESGSRARPCDLTWIRAIVQQCQAAGVPCFVKQLGSKPRRPWGALAQIEMDAFAGQMPRFHDLRLKDPKGGDPEEWDADLRVRQMPEAH